MSDAPVEIGRVALVARDLERLTAFYRDDIGLAELARDPETVRLGVGDRTLIELRGDKAARIADHRQAGLFHTAFLLPDRKDLGAWLRHAAERGLRLDGASDHGVSEALYLRDPEGNGIEIYVDREKAQWPWDGKEVGMFSIRLDLADLMAATNTPWAGAPDGSVVGHVHLQVGDLDRAEGFMTGDLGLDVMQRGPGARFFSSGGYHHHLAGNIWNSQGAGPRASGETGLAEVQLLLDPGLATSELTDPWGTRFSLTRKPA
ncbi:VOC family protein [Paracoccus sp. DMF-8]|uniref:VOC family protein n=1 Tax=Paracoccus sp. DMF-8 TaxID=3019445 RepID=UPI0023E8C791|nr:VOC family protein [Paracoccus sp. DMF-8]MDF3606022.1 VOC family protein [Paracoccus sp. DMF-8]